MIDLTLLVQEGLSRAVVAMVPLVLAALAGSLVAGWLAVRIGLYDPVAAGVLRGLAVLGALTVVAEGMTAEALRVAAEAWSGLASVGRGGQGQ